MSYLSVDLFLLLVVSSHRVCCLAPVGSAKGEPDFIVSPSIRASPVHQEDSDCPITFSLIWQRDSRPKASGKPRAVELGSRRSGT